MANIMELREQLRQIKRVMNSDLPLLIIHDDIKIASVYKQVVHPLYRKQNYDYLIGQEIADYSESPFQGEFVYFKDVLHKQFVFTG